MRCRAFSGRVIFDRMPKTGSHAVARWLREELGTGVVTDNVIGDHLDLIRRHGGLYSIVSAHVQFDGEGLDPRYHYVTCLREPVDRVLSWLYFIISNHRPDELEPGLWQAAKSFVDSDGASLAPSLTGWISDYYVRHFAAVVAGPHESGRDRLGDALAALAHYELCGFYEDLPDLVQDIAKFLQIPPPAQLAAENVTRMRPRAWEISAALRRRIEQLNRQDIALYRRQRDLYRQGLGRAGGLSAPAQPVWTALAEPRSRVVRTSALTLLSACGDSQGRPVSHGAPVTFTLEFELHRPVTELVVGIHIIDQDHRWAFGTNTRILGRPMKLLHQGRYRAQFEVAAELPEGCYHAGFAFVERQGGRDQDLGWFDRQVPFRVQVERRPGDGGYVGLETGFACAPIRPALARRNGFMTTQ